MTTQATSSPFIGSAPSFPELYERHLVPPLFAPWATRLLDRLDLRAGGTLLDVACGTGIAGRLAKQRVSGALRVLGVDRNPAMLAIARDLEPAIEWRDGDAIALPVDREERFDVVCCHQGLQFIPDKAAAVAEMRRALAPGGTVGIGVWRSLGEHDVFNELGQIAQQYVGPITDARHGFSDDQALARLLSAAGLREVRVDQVSLELRFIEPEVLVRLNGTAVVGMSERGRAMSDEDKAATVAAIVAASRPVLERHADNGVLTMRTAANLATGRL